jgi:hypothetical protein
MIAKNIQSVRDLKEKQFLSGETQLLGINLFKTTLDSKDTWRDIPQYLGMDFLIYENLKK